MRPIFKELKKARSTADPREGSNFTHTTLITRERKKYPERHHNVPQRLHSKSDTSLSLPLSLSLSMLSLVLVLSVAHSLPVCVSQSISPFLPRPDQTDQTPRDAAGGAVSESPPHNMNYQPTPTYPFCRTIYTIATPPLRSRARLELDPGSALCTAHTALHFSVHNKKSLLQHDPRLTVLIPHRGRGRGGGGGGRGRHQPQPGYISSPRDCVLDHPFPMFYSFLLTAQVRWIGRPRLLFC